MPTYQLTWLADVLRAAGCKVSEVPGWQTRGRGDMGKVVGVLLHHTAGPLKGTAPSLAIVRDGRKNPPLAGPLAQLVLARDGTWIVVAAGRCNHAGEGDWPGVGRNGGNSRLIGVEAENTGVANDHPWPDVQMRAYARGVAAMLRHIKAAADMAIGHLEYAPKRKVDPSFSIGDRASRLAAMDVFRERVAHQMRDLKVAKPARLLDEPVEGEGKGPGDETSDDEIEQLDAPRDDSADDVDADTIAHVQSRLRELGYFGVGNADGDRAALTRGAIVAFKHDNGLAPETPDIDQAFLAQLVKAKPRAVSDARANATAKDLAQKDRTMLAIVRDKLVKLYTLAGTFLAGLAAYVAEEFRATWAWLGGFRDMLGSVPLWIWLFLAAAILLVGFEFSRRAERDQVDKYRRGELQ
jgi:hypothetical protein